MRSLEHLLYFNQVAKFFLGTTLTVCLLSNLSFAQESCQSQSDFDIITKAVADKFFDKNFKGLDWPARVSHYRKTVKCPSRGEDLALIVNSMLSELKTSHTALYTKSNLEYWGLKSVFSGDLNQFKIPLSGIWPVKINGAWHAQFVLQGSPADKAGVLAGDKLISLDGSEFRALGFSENKIASIVHSHDGVNKKTILIKPVVSSVQQAFLKASQSSENVFSKGAKKIGYFHIWCGTHESFLNAFRASLKRFKKKNVNSLIVDLRDGFGGASPEYLEPLLKDKYFQKIPKVFLINEGVRSGKEWIAAIVKRDKIGTLVGTKTAGAFVAGGPVDIKNDNYLLYLALKEFNPPDIPKLEGIGVEPDIVVPGCHEFCEGKDPQLDWAINNLGERP